MKPIYLFLGLLILTIHTKAQKQAPSQQYNLIQSRNQVEYKNYYLLSLFRSLPEVRKMLQNDVALNAILKAKTEKALEALKNCKKDILCYSNAIKLSADEISAVANRLGGLYKDDNALGNLVSKHLVPSGCYILYADLKPKEMLIKAWEQDAKAINFTIGVYIEGNKPNYPNIDSLGFDLKDKDYPEKVSSNIILALSQSLLFFEPSMHFALEALELDERNNAADYEPMGSTVNKPAIEQIKKTNWKKYKYTVILVPGEGPDGKETELSAGGMLRCRLAALQYQKGMAPFIMVSGGRVHPYKTKYSEAYEMKRFMMNTLDIPESAIIMEPHARHTTTNIRNCVRLMFRYGIPMDKPAITSTLRSQSFYITKTVPERSKNELGYYPYKNGVRLSDTEAEFYPDTMSLQIDFDEPMDP